MPLDSGFRRNDDKGRCLKFVSPANAGVQSKGFIRPGPLIDDVYPIMDSLVICLFPASRHRLQVGEVPSHLHLFSQSVIFCQPFQDLFDHLNHFLLIFGKLSMEGEKVRDMVA